MEEKVRNRERSYYWPIVIWPAFFLILGLILGFILGEIQAYSAMNMTLKANMDRVAETEENQKSAEKDVKQLLSTLEKIPRQGQVPEEEITLCFGEEYDLEFGRKIVSTKNPKTIYLLTEEFDGELDRFYFFPQDEQTNNEVFWTIFNRCTWILNNISKNEKGEDEFTLIGYADLNYEVEKIRRDNWTDSIESRYTKNEQS